MPSTFEHYSSFDVSGLLYSKVALRCSEASDESFEQEAGSDLLVPGLESVLAFQGILQRECSRVWEDASHEYLGNPMKVFLAS